MVTTITPDQFDEQVLQQEQPVVVDFYADWCNPCKEYGPTFDAVSEHYSDVHFVKVDIGQNPDLAMQYGIRSIPATGAFNHGELVQIKPGTLDAESLEQLTESVR